MLKTTVYYEADVKAVVCESDDVILKDEQSALDFASNITYEQDCRNLAVNKAAVDENFFDLSSGLAGEIVQKLVNYGYRLAIIGDFSGYASKALRDFIYESNKGRHLYFVSDVAEAVKMLGRY